MMFQLHPQLQKDCVSLGRFDLCQVLMMNDSQFPWFILVPKVAGATEIFQLSKPQQAMLIDESSQLAERLAKHYKADKINIAAIGNLVPQLHIHHVVRYHTDKAWPAPVWGKFPALPFTDQQLANEIRPISTLLNLTGSA